ncbi:MAG: aminotransferase class I/II-fold pyridoxal phosphate-dependent enzyme [Pseudomonadota bacterium]
MLNLASGHPSRDAYDTIGLTEASHRAAEDPAAWSYGPSLGNPQFLAALAPLSPPHPEGHRLIVTSGAQQAVDLALRCLASPGSTVLLPEPIYPAILSICAAAGLHVRRYRVGADDAGHHRQRQEMCFEDFVIAHEFLHLRVPNHGKVFKELLTAHVPRWRDHDKHRPAGNRSGISR